MKNQCRAPRNPFTRKRALLMLILTFSAICATRSSFAQINAYAKVTAISGKTLTLSNINQSYHTFVAGEGVLLIQMKDNVIGSNTANTSAFGTIAGIASAGAYEAATIASVSGTSMTLTTNPVNTYNTGTNGSVQVVSFNLLSATNYTLSSAVTGVAWNGNVGGVVAFQVGGTLTLSNSVSADGIGFRGGAGSGNYESTCEPSVYDATSSNYAYKGEGIDGSSTITYTTHTGRGPLANGGGGGSDDNGGGGGGSNYTSGGQGGQGWTCTTTNASGGLGGLGLGTYIALGRVFMGGGGGGGQQNNSVGTSGGNGGGIVFIKANQLATSCSGSVSISASGNAAGNSGNDGAGGAGAGGSVVLAIKTFAATSSCPLNLKANGANGGSVTDPNAHGGGGGGGQGAVVFSVALPTANITTTTNNGNGGLNSSSSGSASAGGGGGTSSTGILTSFPILLPVDFLSFSAAKSGQQDVVSWSCSRLDQYVQFFVQRSADGISFHDIGVVDGLVDGRAVASYSFNDASPLNGKNFYRVRRIDALGAEGFSGIEAVDWKGAAASFRIFPNPVSGPFMVQLVAGVTEPVSVQIEDMSGAVVYRSQELATAGRVNVSLGRHLPAGIYIIRVGSRAGVETGKMLIQSGGF